MVAQPVAVALAEADHDQPGGTCGAGFSYRDGSAHHCIVAVADGLS
jgi:hypothetical protein